jgi:DNA-binding NarL/FixJ family response regulator
MKPTRILVADDHEVVRRGVRALIEAEAGWQVCGEALTGRDAVDKAKQLAPDVIILDIGMPELNGLDAARQIRWEAPTTEILILTMHESEQLIREVFTAGARGYVLKSDAGRDLVTAVHALVQHKPFFASAAAQVVLDAYLKEAQGGADQTTSSLTMRQREIIQLLAEGKTNKEVATILQISVKTAETHRTNIMRKLDLHSVSDLVRYAIRNRIVEP